LELNSFSNYSTISFLSIGNDDPDNIVLSTSYHAGCKSGNKMLMEGESYPNSRDIQTPCKTFTFTDVCTGKASPNMLYSVYIHGCGTSRTSHFIPNMKTGKRLIKLNKSKLT